MLKNYILQLLELGENDFAQKAIEHAIVTGAFKPCGELALDTFNIMELYSHFVEAYQAHCQSAAGIDRLPHEKANRKTETDRQLRSEAA